jgi:hypothetical protein
LNGSVAGVLIALVVSLAAIGLLTAKEEKASERSGSGSEAPAGKLSVELVARRVERIRELRFDGLPRLQRVSADQARAAVLTELDRNVARSEQEAGERLLKLLGLLPAEASLRETLARATASEVGGYYVPRTDTLALVRGAGLEGVLGEVALAHELVHALEDQRFGLEAGAGMLWRDRATARSGLAEGTATLAMVDYLAQSQGAGDELPAELRERVLEQIGELTIPAAGGLPRYVRESLVFPYAAGAALVNRIQSEGGWAAVDEAYGGRPVLSSEQLMHPDKYDTNEKPVRVRRPDLAELLPEGATELTRGDLGEFDTEQFLREGNGRERSERAAAGWGGSAFELWELPGGGEVLVAVWEWDTPRDAREFGEAATRRLSELDAAGAIRGNTQRRTVLVLAPRAALAERIAAALS